ncbi:hypothetical protein PG993_003497 [Apiospora rasikravindrae]|uniref:Uncharacterized protein n=1 Tax=Apiospora rasikravindrae TaxID=990691 RepID=A0ABR1TZS1_9PEZI
MTSGEALGANSTLSWDTIVVWQDSGPPRLSSVKSYGMRQCCEYVGERTGDGKVQIQCGARLMWQHELISRFGKQHGYSEVPVHVEDIEQ